jgi:HPt (histidine-containing phosphotransfer) domain-containing protein
MGWYESAPVTEDLEVGVVDERILSELFTVIGGGDPGSLVDACELFLTHLPTRLGAAEAAVADGRLADASRLAHSVKGSAGAFGACRLSLLAERLERACDDGDGERGGSIVEQMTVDLATFATILRERLAEVTSA